MLPPGLPPETMVANLTLDMLQTAGRKGTSMLIGQGQSDDGAAWPRPRGAQGRTITPDAPPERGLFYRADHFSLAKRGVPVLSHDGAGRVADLVDGGRAAGDKWLNDFTGNCYHQPCDAWSASWDLSGAVQDVALVYRMGLDLGNGTTWPSWKPGSEFAPIRAKSRQ